jgi:hypothetical protein
VVETSQIWPGPRVWQILIAEWHEFWDGGVIWFGGAGYWAACESSFRRGKRRLSEEEASRGEMGADLWRGVAGGPWRKTQAVRAAKMPCWR